MSRYWPSSCVALGWACTMCGVEQAGLTQMRGISFGHEFTPRACVHRSGNLLQSLTAAHIHALTSMHEHSYHVRAFACDVPHLRLSETLA